MGDYNGSLQKPFVIQLLVFHLLLQQDFFLLFCRIGAKPPEQVKYNDVDEKECDLQDHMKEAQKAQGKRTVFKDNGQDTGASKGERRNEEKDTPQRNRGRCVSIVTHRCRHKNKTAQRPI